jgi:glycosyltransferase involved in cell wall biosynthesis
VSAVDAAVNALFINSGILGQRTFADFVETAFAEERDGVRAVQTLVTDDLTAGERLLRFLLCLHLWPQGVVGIKNLDLHRYRCELNAGLLARNRLRRLERRGRRFDVIHFHRQTTAYASLPVMRRIPSIVSIDSTQRCVLQNARSRLETRSYAPNVRRDGEIFRAARLIVTTSAWAARSLREDYPDCATETVVMPNPVPLPPASDGWIEERYARAAAGGSAARVLFVGGDFPRKGGFDLLEVWRAGRFHERARLHIMSNWPLDPASLPDGVTLHRGVSAHTPAWDALWRAADIFALPTLDEAFGIVFQEAAAAGLPAIGTHLNAVPEIIDDGATGLLCRPADKGELARALDTLLASADLRRRMGTRARAAIAASADPERYRRDLAAAIRRVAGR